MKKRYVTLAGRTIIIRESVSTCGGGKGKKRKARKNKTTKAVAKINRINRERELTAKLNHNFKPGDLLVTLTYADASGTNMTREECMKRFRNYRKNIQRWGKKHGVVVKMIDSFEWGQKNGRPHHHVVMSYVPTEILKKYWKGGYCHVEMLHGFNYQKVAKYMLKDVKAAENGKILRAYNCTRNIVKPITRVEIIEKKDLVRDSIDIDSLEPFGGYYIDRDSVYKYQHAIYEIECIEYIMISLEEEPKLAGWMNGQKVEMEKQYAVICNKDSC